MTNTKGTNPTRHRTVMTSARSLGVGVVALLLGLAAMVSLTAAPASAQDPTYLYDGVSVVGLETTTVRSGGGPFGGYDRDHYQSLIYGSTNYGTGEGRVLIDEQGICGRDYEVKVWSEAWHRYSDGAVLVSLTMNVASPGCSGAPTFGGPSGVRQFRVIAPGQTETLSVETGFRDHHMRAEVDFTNHVAPKIDLSKVAPQVKGLSSFDLSDSISF